MSEKSKLWRTFKKNKTALIGTVIALFVILLAILAPLVSPYDPLDQDISHRLRPPDRSHLLGTDEYGRDVFSRIVWGARVSLAVGVLSILFGLFIGTAMGMFAGYRGGLVDTGIMRMVDVLLSFPTLITGIMVVALLGSGMMKLIITIGIVFRSKICPAGLWTDTGCQGARLRLFGQSDRGQQLQDHPSLPVAKHLR